MTHSAGKDDMEVEVIGVATPDANGRLRRAYQLILSRSSDESTEDQAENPMSKTDAALAEGSNVAKGKEGRHVSAVSKTHSCHQIQTYRS